MRVTIRQKNLRITPPLETYIEKKIVAPARRLLGEVGNREIPVLDLEFGRTTKRHKKGPIYYAEAMLAFGKKGIRAESTAEDMRAACDALKDELEREFSKLKGRREALRRRGARGIKRETRYAPEAHMRRGARVRDESR